MTTMKKQSILFTTIFLFGLYGSSSFAQGSLIQDVEDKWADMNFCKQHVLDDPQLDYAIYQNDRNRWKATDTFLRNFARETFGPADAQKLETKADLAGAFMTWGKGKKPFKSLPLEDKFAAVKWCRGGFLKE